jgi:hypothetical protein
MSLGQGQAKKNVRSRTEKAASCSLVPVLYARPSHAKMIKTGLEELNRLSKVHRMTKVAAGLEGDPPNEENTTFWFLKHVGRVLEESEFDRYVYEGQQSGSSDAESPKERFSIAINMDKQHSSVAPPTDKNSPLIAIPILTHSGDYNDQNVSDTPDLIQTWISETPEGENFNAWIRYLVGWGDYSCPLSTAAMGNGSTHLITTPRNDRTSIESVSFLHQCLFNCILERINQACADEASYQFQERLMEDIYLLPPKECPAVEAHALEKLGNDTTLLPPGAFPITASSQEGIFDGRVEETPENRRSELECLLMKYLKDDHGPDASAVISDFQHRLFQNIVRRMTSSVTKKNRRLARKSEIHPDSPIRESQCVLLYHDGHPNLTLIELQVMCRAANGSASPGWITIKEHGIRQSFDLTKVMFSRGNVTEKLRFGTECVRSNEVVLDMYAGIGYYTLPAMILGHAKQVYACEWNANAIIALKHNIQDNGIECASDTTKPTSQEAAADGRSRLKGATISDKIGRFVQVFQGDCRQSCQRFGIVDCVDRVSLGLLPSSEGGWKTAVHSLRHDRGGWLHVHGNVPTAERTSWAIWLCFCLLKHSESIRQQTGHAQWKIVCHKVVKVKSFAPRIDHVVANVFMGPLQECLKQLGTRTNAHLHNARSKMEQYSVFSVEGSSGKDSSCCLLHHDVCPGPPSCALNPSGVLHQRWMMDTSQTSCER